MAVKDKIEEQVKENTKLGKYELVVVLPGGATKAKRKSVVDTITKIVDISGGGVLSVDDWGDRELVYSIKDNNIGVFLIFSLDLNSKGAVNLEAKVRHNEDIIRYLLV